MKEPRNLTALGKNGSWVRIISALTVLFLLLMVAEFILGILPLERYDSLFIPRGSYPVFVPGFGEHRDFYVTNSHFKGSLNFQQFSMKKESGLKRIFILGGSAAAGWAGKDEDAFSGYLRRAFEKILPGKFEIVNAAGISYGSHRVRNVMEDVLLHEPDLVILYSGNNEYVERNVLPENEKKGGTLFWTRDLLSSTDIYRAVRLALWKVPIFREKMEEGRSGDPTDIRANPVVRRGKLGRTSEIDREVLANYRENLGQIAAMAYKASVPVIFCSVPVNMDSWRPDGMPPEFKDEEEMQKWSVSMEIGTTFLRNRQFALALEPFKKALDLAPDWAPAAYFYARALQGNGQLIEAARMYEKARDKDARPIRAFGEFNDEIRDIPDGHGKKMFLDLERVFNENSPDGITGNELIMDYCHPSEAGHKLIARALLPLVGAALEMDLPLADLEEHVREDKTVQLRNPRSRTDQLYALAMNYQFNGRIDEAEEIYNRILKLDPVNTHSLSNLGVIHYQRGELDVAEKLFSDAVKADQGNIDASFNLGLVHLAMDSIDEAEQHFFRVLELNKQSGPAHVALGDIAQKRGNIQSAIDSYKEALSLGGESPHLRFMLGKAYLAAGNREQARIEFMRAQALDPSDVRIIEFLKDLDVSEAGSVR